MATSEHWMFPRPLRKLTHVPERLTLFLSIAEGKRWAKNKELHLEFEDALSEQRMKGNRGYRERLSPQGNPGSTGRTNVAGLMALGLIGVYPDSKSGDEVICSTLAGSDIADGKPAREILKYQVLKYQFPSAYSESSSNTKIAARFNVRPAIFLLKVLQDERLGGYLTQKEIAYILLTHGDSEDSETINKVIELVLNFRNDGIDSLGEDYFSKFKTRKNQSNKNFLEGLNSYANTFLKWMDYTGYTIPGAEPQSVSICMDYIDEINEFIHQLSGKHLSIKKLGPINYQLKYGVTPGKIKDTRNMEKVVSPSPSDREKNLVISTYFKLFRTEILTEVTGELIERIKNQTGISSTRTENILNNTLPSRTELFSEFLQNYEMMAFSGTEYATDFETATASILRDHFELGALHVGQSGDKKMPDVEVWCAENASKWFGIIDNKAYPAYNLPNDHSLRMEFYLKRYEKHPYGPANFFIYIAGGYTLTFNNRLLKLIEKTQTSGSAFSITPWIRLIRDFSPSKHNKEDLIKLFTTNRTVSLSDVEKYLSESIVQ